MPTRKIVAIGGGEIGRPGQPVETEAIDRFALSLTGKETPIVSFIPTASRDSRGYIITAYEHFKKRLGAKFREVLVSEMENDFEKVRQKIMTSDMVYVGGGSTLHMMKTWRRTGFDLLLREAYEAGIVCAGLSAGANCWFEKSHSDSFRLSKPESPYVFVTGLGFVPGTFCPHYDSEADRAPDLHAKLMKRGGSAYAADNCSALVFIDDSMQVVRSKDAAKVRKLRKEGGNIHETEIL